MANGHNYEGPVTDGTLYYISDGARSLQLKQIETHSVSDDGSVTVHKGPAGNIGSSRTSAAFSISLTLRRPKSAKPEVDFRRMRATDARFRFEIQDIGAPREQYFDCRVANVNSKSDSSGVTEDVTIVSTSQEIVYG